MKKRVQLLYAGLIGAALFAVPFAQSSPLFRLPLSSDTSVHYYYDDNRASGPLTDWACGSSTYDNHNGTDFSGGPRGRAIFAAANGTLKEKVDGFGDGFVGSTAGGGAGNHVVINHGGSPNFHTWYMHMTAGSVTTKGVGASISCSEQIGGVGTSGSSSGLHLHFGVYPDGPNFTHDDPFSGSCGGPISYWVNQNGGHPVTTCQGGGTATIVVDNSSANFTASTGWATGTSATDKNGADYRFHSTSPASDQAVWNASLPAAGNYAVYVWYPAGSNRSATAPYSISTSAGSSTVSVNQQLTGGQWVGQGVHNMAAGANTIKLSFWTTSGFIVVADAVKWVQQ
ncbi:MAG: N-acetylmuramoyl-L-alanine amidase [Verrucomicrobiales bacterium]|nr:N-acetylmuramoyl-L-alanine amidase [Verrucomicrobiales bacterium]